MLALLFNKCGLQGRQQTPRVGCPVPWAVSQGELSEDKGTLIRGDSEKILQGLTLELTECLPWSFRIMVRSF